MLGDCENDFLSRVFIKEGKPETNLVFDGKKATLQGLKEYVWALKELKDNSILNLDPWSVQLNATTVKF